MPVKSQSKFDSTAKSFKVLSPLVKEREGKAAGKEAIIGKKTNRKPNPN
jgi:hypothetical protein